MNHLVLFVVTSLLCYSQVSGADDLTYRAVVVEYSPQLNSSLDAKTNIMNNVMNYVEIIRKAAYGDIMADIIVFPEIGLKGYSNAEYPVEVPDPADQVKPCATFTKYEAPLVQLSCAAAATNTYVVVNLAEKLFVSGSQSYRTYNTDVVFDSSGVIIARYRKINLYNEGSKSPSPDGELVYFDTEFGVRFGLFTCFDIIFKNPPLDLAKEYNISHFIFPTAWFQEAPFLTGIQEQWYWAFTQNAVLLASGYNLPSHGSSGSGIYLGRQGPITYKMADLRTSFMLAAYVPKQLPEVGNHVDFNTSFISLSEPSNENIESTKISSEVSDKLKLKQDFLSVYSTELLYPNSDHNYALSNSSTLNIPLVIERQICQNTLCCQFILNITLVYNLINVPIARGDDYSQLFYRLAVFDGVRSYNGAATGGVQTCAIIPCVTNSVDSCAMRSDDASASPATFGPYVQTAVVFHNVTISGNFSNQNTFVGPDILLEGEGDNYGSLMSTSSFIFSSVNSTNTTSVNVLQTVKPVDNLVTMAVYARVFSRDGEQYTGYVPDSTKSAGFDLCLDMFLLLVTLACIKYCLN